MPPSNLMTARALLAKREATPYTAEALLAANGIGDLSALEFLAVDAKRMETPNMSKGQFGNVAAQNDTGAAVQSVSASTPVRAASAAGSVPADVAELFAGLCGMSETINVGTSVVYAPQTPSDLDTAPTASLALYEAGKLSSFVGARGNVKLSATVGQRLLAQFDIKAPYAAPTPNQSIPVVTATVGNPLTFTGAVAVTEAGNAVDIGSIELDLGNDVIEHVTNQGIKILVKENAPKITINPVALVTAVEWNDLLASTSVAINANFGTGGMVLSIATAQLVDMVSEDQDGRIGRTKTFECLGGDTAFTLTF